MSRAELPVIEIFGPTIQGEGKLCGHRTHFIRLGGCTYRCSWCDTMYAVDPVEVKKNAKWMTLQEICESILKLPPSPWITLSGGDPLMHGDKVYHLMRNLRGHGFKVAIETQGAFYYDWLCQASLVTVSPKPPSSGMAEKFDAQVMTQYYQAWLAGADVNIKVVVFDIRDMDFAEELHSHYPGMPFYVSVGTPQGLTAEETVLDIREALVSTIGNLLRRRRMSDVIILPQMHAIIWPKRKGV